MKMYFSYAHGSWVNDKGEPLKKLNNPVTGNAKCQKDSDNNLFDYSDFVKNCIKNADDKKPEKPINAENKKDDKEIDLIFRIGNLDTSL